MAEEIFYEYVQRLRAYLEGHLIIGKPVEIEPLTDDKEKFIKAMKYIIRNYHPDYEFSSDWTKIRINPADHIVFPEITEEMKQQLANRGNKVEPEPVKEVKKKKKYKPQTLQLKHSF